MRKKILMIQPQMGFAGNFVKHIPLGLLYASVDLVKHDFDVKIIDNRLMFKRWKEGLKKQLTSDVLLVGISVMSGYPIKSAVEIGRYVKGINKEIKIIWGGPHATFFPRTILENDWNCDYVISGYGSKSLYLLVEKLLSGKDIRDVPGVSYLNGDKVVSIPNENRFEHINFKDIPYHLISKYTDYGQLDSDEIIFSMYSVLGCPYLCSFCSSPAQYKKFSRRWELLDHLSVCDHITYLIEKYNASYIYFIDDDSFVNLKHVEKIIDEVDRRKINVKLGFRGARISEIKKMSDEFLVKLKNSGTNIMHIGAESGSDRILNLLKKDCTVKDIIECNKKLSRHPKIRAAYNFIVGIPTETMDELKATLYLMLKLLEDNPNCIIFHPNKYRPLPGTELFELLKEKWDYSPPKSLEEWVNIEAEGDSTEKWYPKEAKEFCNLLLVGCYFIDNKICKLTSGKSTLYKLFKLLNMVYGPIARYRLKHGIYQGLIEYTIYKIITKHLRF